MGRAQRRQQQRRPTPPPRPTTWLRSITRAAALMADPLNAEQATPGPRALAARAIQHGLTLLAEGAGLLEEGHAPGRVLELLEHRLSELADHLSPAPEAPMPTPAPLSALERAWRYVYPDTPTPSPATMLADLRAWAREHHAPAMAQAAAKRQLMAEAA